MGRDSNERQQNSGHAMSLLECHANEQFRAVSIGKKISRGFGGGGGGGVGEGDILWNSR